MDKFEIDYSQLCKDPKGQEILRKKFEEYKKKLKEEDEREV